MQTCVIDYSALVFTAIERVLHSGRSMTFVSSDHVMMIFKTFAVKAQLTELLYCYYNIINAKLGVRTHIECNYLYNSASLFSPQGKETLIGVSITDMQVCKRYHGQTVFTDVRSNGTTISVVHIMKRLVILWSSYPRFSRGQFAGYSKWIAKKIGNNGGEKLC